MRTERPRPPIGAWIATISGLYCFGIVAWHVSAIAQGHPLATVWWGLPINSLGVLFSVLNARREARRAAARTGAPR